GRIEEVLPHRPREPREIVEKRAAKRLQIVLPVGEAFGNVRGAEAGRQLGERAIVGAGDLVIVERAVTRGGNRVDAEKVDPFALAEAAEAIAEDRDRRSAQDIPELIEAGRAEEPSLAREMARGGPFPIEQAHALACAGHAPEDE